MPLDIDKIGKIVYNLFPCENMGFFALNKGDFSKNSSYFI
jgi:hypothetical protein